MTHNSILVASLLLLAGCTAPQDAPSEAALTAEDWAFDTAASALRETSCPMGVSFEKAADLALSVEAIDRGTPADNSFRGVRFVGAWHLISDDERFGGLSGLEAMASGSLLSIADTGAWVSIGIDPATGKPDGLATMAPMRSETGDIVASKRLHDAEGLAMRDGLALVSFEQNHRIAAFDIEGCGAAARPAPVVDLPRRVAGMKVPDNRGGEALMLRADGTLRVGFEFTSDDGAAIGTVLTTGDLADISFEDLPPLYKLTGMDIDGDLTAQLYRAYDPVRGARIRLQLLRAGEPIGQADFKGDLPVDNFEGVAISKGPEGQIRIWMISDNNFNDAQRTLLFAVDLDPATAVP
ncbi:MAG: esterase-like activity of phytase family protein [Pseudomonadota bacterium]